MTTSILVCIVSLATGAPEHFVLEADENVWDVAVEDMNGDGLGDVLLLCSDETSYPLKKSVQVHTADASGAYSATPSFSLPLDTKAGLLFFAEVDGTAPKELVVASSSGAWVHRYTGEGFAQTAEPRFVSLWPSYAKEPLFIRDCAMDLDGDGIDAWLIPVPEGYEVWNAQGRVAAVSCDVVSEIRRNDSTYIYHRLPAYKFFELEGSAQKGLAFLSDEFADFACGPGWTEHQRFKIPVNLEEKWEASAEMADVDKNGFPDLMVTQTKGTINLQALTQLYVATGPFTYPEEPTAAYTSKGAVASPALLDVDGDEQLDLLLISIPFGLKNFMNFFLRGKVAVNVAVYLYDGEGFGKKPAYKTTLTMDAPEGRERVAYTMGDFNGDGRLDVAFGREDDTLVVHTGEPNRFVSSRPWVTLELPSFGLARPYDLDGKAGKDIILFHPGGENAKRVEVIVF